MERGPTSPWQPRVAASPGLSLAPRERTPAKFVDYYDHSKLDAAIAAQGKGDDGRTVLNEKSMSGLLVPVSGFTTRAKNNVTYEKPEVYGPRTGANWEVVGGTQALNPGWQEAPRGPDGEGGSSNGGAQPTWVGNQSQLIRTFNAGSFKGPDGKFFRGVDTPPGQDPNAQYAQYTEGDGRGFKNPTGNDGDRVAPACSSRALTAGRVVE